MTEQIKSENKLGEMPVGKLLVTMSIPMMISFFIQALYNMIDSMYVAKICEEALTAVTLAYPLQNIMSSIAVGTGVGINALVPRYLSMNNREKAEKTANIALFLSVIYTFVFALIGIFFARTYYAVQTSDALIVQYGEQYLSVVCTISVGVFFGQCLEKLLVATGNSMLSMIAMATGAITNIIMDPILIFGLGPIAPMGVKGAAVATVIGQILGACVAYGFNLSKNKSVKLGFKKMMPQFGIIKEIFTVGFPSIITMGLASMMSFCVNQIFLGFSVTATAVFGIWQKLQNFAYMPIFGMNNGMVPILSYNYGAKKNERVKQTISNALKLSICLMILLAVGFELFAPLLLSLFNASETMLKIGTHALRILCLSLPFGATCVILSTFFQALMHSRYSVIINVCRQFVIMSVMFWILAQFNELSILWFAVIITEVLSLFIALFLFKKCKKELSL